jgi:hypothetical protein
MLSNKLMMHIDQLRIRAKKKESDIIKLCFGYQLLSRHMLVTANRLIYHIKRIRETFPENVKMQIYCRYK